MEKAAAGIDPVRSFGVDIGVSTTVAVVPEDGGDVEGAGVDGEGAGIDGEGAGVDGEGAGVDGEGV